MSHGADAARSASSAAETPRWRRSRACDRSPLPAGRGRRLGALVFPSSHHLKRTLVAFKAAISVLSEMSVSKREQAGARVGGRGRDRQNVVWGKSGAGCVDTGGRRIFKKKNK